MTSALGTQSNKPASINLSTALGPYICCKLDCEIDENQVRLFRDVGCSEFLRCFKCLSKPVQDQIFEQKYPILESEKNYVFEWIPAIVSPDNTQYASYLALAQITPAILAEWAKKPLQLEVETESESASESDKEQPAKESTVATPAAVAEKEAPKKTDSTDSKGKKRRRRSKK